MEKRRRKVVVHVGEDMAVSGVMGGWKKAAGEMIRVLERNFEGGHGVVRWLQNDDGDERRWWWNLVTCMEGDETVE